MTSSGEEGRAHRRFGPGFVLFFALLHDNDPHLFPWAAICLLAGPWCALAAWRPGKIAASQPLARGLVVSFVAFLAGFGQLAPMTDADWIPFAEARLICVRVSGGLARRLACRCHPEAT